MRPLLLLACLAFLGPVGCVQAPPRPAPVSQAHTDVPAGATHGTVAASAERSEGLTLRTAASGWGQRQRDLAR
ncbi:MAG: hypothetical protein KF878_06150 [Planctomycetes bacterium]|nr:hypothetical protein [Planctomycetota bacterium]